MITRPGRHHYGLGDRLRQVAEAEREARWWDRIGTFGQAHHPPAQRSLVDAYRAAVAERCDWCGVVAVVEDLCDECGHDGVCTVCGSTVAAESPYPMECCEGCRMASLAGTEADGT